MRVIIREAVPDDAEQMIAHVQRLTEEPDRDIPLAPGEFRYTVEEERGIVERYAAADNSIFLVAEVEGSIVGVLNCDGGKRHALRHSAVLGISVRREWRNQGVGRALMAHAVEWARASGIITRLELTVYARNAAAIHLYQSFGFEEEGRRRRAIYQNGEYLDDLVMGLLL